MSILLGYGPQYILGFVITFFTLMSSRYLLGLNIHPQERIVRVMLLSIIWLPALVISTIFAYIYRADRLNEIENEADCLRQELNDLKETEQFIDSTNTEESDDDVADGTQSNKAAEPLERKGWFKW